MFLNEIQDVFLRLSWEALTFGQVNVKVLFLWQCAPEVISLRLNVFLALLLCELLLLLGKLARPLIAIHTIIHQCMAGVNDFFYRLGTVLLLTLIDVVSSKDQIVQDPLSIGPLTEHVVILEEVIVTEGGMRDNQ